MTRSYLVTPTWMLGTVALDPVSSCNLVRVRNEGWEMIELSLYLARAWGLFSVLVPLGLLLNRQNYLQMVNTLKPDDFSVLIAGVFALVMGVVQVVGYNSWTFDYRGLITLLGWVALLKGIAILFVPGYMGRFARAIA